MSLLNTDISVVYDVSGGYAASYPITFRYFDAADIIAVLTINEGEEDESTETLALTTNYTLTDPDVSGTLTKVGDWTAADKLTIYREVAVTQPLSIPNRSTIDGPTVEKQLDRMVAMLQKLQYGTAFTNPESVAISTFMATMLDDVNAAAALATLGLTATASELNHLDGITSSVSELNALHGIASPSAVLAALNGISATAAEINYASDRSAFSAAKSADYTILDSDGYSLLLVTTGAASKTITLPTVADNTNRKIKIMKVDSGAGYAIVDGEGSETINGTLTWEITEQYGFIEIVSTGTEWLVINKNRCTLYKSTSTSTGATVAANFATNLLSVAIKAGKYIVEAKTTGLGNGAAFVATVSESSGTKDNTYLSAEANTDSTTGIMPLYIKGEKQLSSDGTLYLNLGIGASGSATTYYTYSTVATGVHYLFAERIA